MDDRWSLLGFWRERPDQILRSLRPQREFFTLRRYGGHQDGSYLLPDLDSWEGEKLEAVFSAGVGNRKEFEDELLLGKGIHTYLLDKSSSAKNMRTPLYPGQILEQKWLSHSNTPDSVTLDHWVAGHSSGRQRNLILSVDIEGAEWPSLAFASPEVMDRFAIIIIELHRMQDCGDPAVFRTRIAPMLRTLFAHHTAVHVAPNNCCGTVMLPSFGIAMPRTLEITLVHNKDFPKISALNADSSTPHPLDNFQNQHSKPPLFLVGQWWESINNKSGKSRRREALRNWSNQDDVAVNNRLVDDLGDLFEVQSLWSWRSRILAFSLTGPKMNELDMLGITFRSPPSRSFFAGAVLLTAKRKGSLFLRLRFQALVRDVSGARELRFNVLPGLRDCSRFRVFVLGGPIERIERVEAIGR